MYRRFVWMSLLISSGAWAFGQDNVLSTATTTGDEGIVNGYIGGLSNQANPNVGNVPGNRYNGSIEVDYYKKGNTAFDKSGRFTFAGQYNDAGLVQYSLQEAYTSLPLSEKNAVKAGRQILPWSTVDQAWGFGKLNNRRNFNYFEPGQEGLIGLQFERKADSGVRIRAFYSPIYVPELNPPLDINKNDKTVSSRSQWANPPATTADVQGTQMPIQYNVDYPSLSKVVYRHSVGVNLGYEDKHWQMDNFIMRKPENQISAKVDVKVNTIDQVVKANVRPQFYYHDVFGSTLKWRNRDIEVYASGIGIRPNTFPDGDRDATRFTEIKTEKRREDYVGGGISKTNDLYGIGINYVARLSPFDRQKEQLAEDPRWNQAVNPFGYFALTRSFTIFGDLKYDMLTTDRLIMVRGAYNFSRHVQLMAGVNSIGTPTNGKSYWSPYTNNDMVYGALRYIF
ncbi:MAG: hypothetical protein ACJ76H_14050 [Bacteriovoracaceae bacterium]